MIKYAYIHIPFCSTKCRYCSFVSGINVRKKDEYLNALKSEIKTKYKKERLKTLYIGGGTPSLLDITDIKDLVGLFRFERNAEVTLEVNPETVSVSKFTGYKNAGINRISLGVQTFNNDILRLTGRNHTQKDIYNAISDIKSAGFENISIDLIYGLPNQTYEGFKTDIEKALSLDVPHISAYGLKIEENSYFYKHYPKNVPDNDMQAEMYLMLCKYLKQNGFIHYEISNFAQKSYSSKHNTAYWKNKNYYGFGLNASGYEGNTRYKNTSVLNEYLNNPMQKEEDTRLSDEEILEEEIFLALRLKSGIDINKINKKFNIDFMKKYKKIIEKYSKLKLIKCGKTSYKLTEQGFLLSNDVMSEFIE